MSSIPAPVIPVSREELIQAITEALALIEAYESALGRLPLDYFATAVRHLGGLARQHHLAPGVAARLRAVLIRCQQEQD